MSARQRRMDGDSARNQMLRKKEQERRLENAFLARDNCEEDSWGWNYWNNVIGALTRKLNRELTIPYK